jgi:hypothetical protein
MGPTRDFGKETMIKDVRVTKPLKSIQKAKTSFTTADDITFFAVSRDVIRSGNDKEPREQADGQQKDGNNQTPNQSEKGHYLRTGLNCHEK